MTGVYVRCRFCGKPLTDPESRTRGYGPDCAAERGLPHGNVRLVPAGQAQQTLDLEVPTT